MPSSIANTTHLALIATIAGACIQIFAEYPISECCHAKEIVSLLQKKIDLIASVNKEPQIVEAAHRAVAVFDDNFDWREQRRVKNAVASLWKATSDEEWDVVVAHSADRRYSITIRSTEHDDAANMTVGDQCRKLAFMRLVDVFYQHVMVASDRNTICRHLEISEKNIRQWRESRKGVPLHKLQIEVCEKAIDCIRRQSLIADESRASTIRAIGEEIESLKKEGKAFCRQHNTEWLEAYLNDPGYDAVTGKRKGQAK